MNTNFSRPSLGLNQSSLFQASDDLATNSLTRNEFIKNPDLILNKYGIPLLSKGIDVKVQKTSEICTPGVFLCLAFLGLGALAYAVTTAATVNTVYSVTQCYTEFTGCSINVPLSNDSYIGIC